MKQGLIGVIVPVYKVEKFIAECIESILAQTYTNFRLILVDDGSPDNAGKICDEYAKKDSRITVIHQENAGVTRARARGVEEAEDCEWITFVDSDDTLPEYTLKLLYSATEEDTDIIFTDNVLNYPYISSDYISIGEYQDLLIEEKTSSAPWAKLFRKTIFDGGAFNIPREIVMGEDLIMILNLTQNSKNKVKVIHTHIYNYNRHEENISHKFQDSAKHEYLLYSCMTAFMEEHSNSVIKRSLNKWNRLFGYTVSRPIWFGTSIHKAILSDIIKHNYKIGILEYILLRTGNPIIRFFAINIKKLNNKIKSLLA